MDDNRSSKKLEVVDNQQPVLDVKPVPEVKPEGGVNGDMMGDGNVNVNSTPTAGRAKKSVRWSEELVRESPRAAAINSIYAAHINNYQNQNHNGSSNLNPYVNYSPAASNPPPPSFNFMGELSFLCIYLDICS